jgi:hypothetical protein
VWPFFTGAAVGAFAARFEQAEDTSSASTNKRRPPRIEQFYRFAFFSKSGLHAKGRSSSFFLDIDRERLYIWLQLRSKDRKSDVRENQSMKNATKKAAKKAAKKPAKKAAAKKKK